MSDNPIPGLLMLVACVCGGIIGFAGRDWMAHADEAARVKAEKAKAVAVVQYTGAAKGITAASAAGADIKKAATRATTAAIIERVPYYVTVRDDASCSIPVGFERLHDAAARGDLSDLSGASGKSDEAPSSLALSAVAGTVTENYGICHETADQLTALQDWVTAQRTLATGQGPSKETDHDKK